MLRRGFTTLCIFLFLLPVFIRGQDASDIVVPPGFRAEKVLDGNKSQDPQNIAFLPSGDFLVASMMWRIIQVDPSSGTVSTRAKFQTNKGPNPYDILATPSGEIYFSHWDRWSDPGLYRLEGDQSVRITPPGWRFEEFDRDDSGCFYANTVLPNPLNYVGIMKVSDLDGDGTYEDVQPLIPLNVYIFYRNGYLYLLRLGTNGAIVIYDTLGNYCGQIVGGLYNPSELAMDSMGNFYTTVGDGSVEDGFGTYSKRDVLKISPAGTTEIVADDIRGSVFIAIAPDDSLYLSEFDRGAISRVVNGVKSDITEGHVGKVMSGMAFDLLNRPHYSSFRLSQLRRLDPEAGTSVPVTPMLGRYTQTIAVDGEGQFYLSEGSKNRLFKVDPLSESIADIWTMPWSRMLSFDSQDRLVVVQSSVITGPTQSDTNTILGIFGFSNGITTPYVAGHDLTRNLFDKNQNLFARYRRSEGILKVNVPLDPIDPPFEANPSTAELYYDLSSKDSEIRYFDQNPNGQLLIPLVDTGEIILGEVDGSWRVFASGFDWPGYVNFDRNGVMYVVDAFNGLYRIIGREFVIPAVIERLYGLEEDVSMALINAGLKAALCKILGSAVISLNNDNITSAMKQIESFIIAVSAQKGKKIPTSDADRFVAVAGSINLGLKLL